MAGDVVEFFPSRVKVWVGGSRSKGPVFVRYGDFTKVRRCTHCGTYRPVDPINYNIFPEFELDYDWRFGCASAVYQYSTTHICCNCYSYYDERYCKHQDTYLVECKVCGCMFRYSENKLKKIKNDVRSEVYSGTCRRDECIRGYKDHLEFPFVVKRLKAEAKDFNEILKDVRKHMRDVSKRGGSAI